MTAAALVTPELVVHPAALRRGGAARWLWAVVVVAGFCVPLFVGLGRNDLANDEAIYSFSVDVMLEQGDWLAPKAIPREDITFLEKPPLKCWIVALPIKLGLLPHNEFGLRFWDALFGAVAFLYVFAIGRRLGGPLCGLAALLVLFAHRPLLFEHGLRENNMEAPLVVAYSAAMYHFLRWRSGRRARLHILAIGLWFVLGFMTKFVAAVFLPMVLALAVLLRRADRQRAMADWRAIAGTSALVVAICAPWFVYSYERFGPLLWQVMLGSQVFTRLTSYLDPAHLHPWHYYLTRLVAELQASHVAWFALGGAVLVAARTVGRRCADCALLMLWFAVPLALISLGTSKLYHYAYPFLPPVALAVGYLVAELGEWTAAALRHARIDGWMTVASRPFARSTAGRTVLVAIAVAGATLAVASVLLGHVRLAVGDAVLLRISSPLRPMIVVLVALMLAGYRRLSAAVVVPMVLVSLMPLGAYRHNLQQFADERHPLRSLAACMQPVADGQAAASGKRPGVYVESDEFLHPLSYYLRRLGPWHQLPERSDAKVFVAMYLTKQPVLLSDVRRRQFEQAMATRGDDVIREAAAMAGVSVSEAGQAFAHRGSAGAVPFSSAELALPGAYAACAAAASGPIGR